MILNVLLVIGLMGFTSFMVGKLLRYIVKRADKLNEQYEQKRAERNRNQRQER